MKNVIELLFTLQGLEMGPAAASPDVQVEIQQLRQQIPPPILGHYDRLRARGKKGVALVRNGVCSECHMRLASGINAELIRAEDIMICDNCGRYLLAEKVEAVPPPPVAEELKPEKAPAKKRRKKNTAIAA